MYLYFIILICILIVQVNSGDSITIREEVYNGYPKEKQITLNNIIAPKLGRRA